MSKKCEFGHLFLCHNLYSHELTSFLIDLISHICSTLTCCGIYNAFRDPKKNAVRLVATYVFIGEGRLYRMGSYNGCPAIVSSQCERIGVINVELSDGGRKWCLSCHRMWYKRGNSNIGNKFLKNWEYVLSKCLKQRKREKLCPTNFVDAERFYKTADAALSEKGFQLKEEAIAQCDYGRHTARLAAEMKDERIKLVVESSAPNPSDLFSVAADLY